MVLPSTSRGVSSTEHVNEAEKEDRIVKKTVDMLQEMIAAGGYINRPVDEMKSNTNKKQTNAGKGSEGNTKKPEIILPAVQSNSESTIYKNVVEPAVHQGSPIQLATRGVAKVVNRDSTSSEDDVINSSGEFAAQEQIKIFFLSMTEMKLEFQETRQWLWMSEGQRKPIRIRKEDWWSQHHNRLL